jgi:hypothetical protein
LTSHTTFFEQAIQTHTDLLTSYRNYLLPIDLENLIDRIVLPPVCLSLPKKRKNEIFLDGHPVGDGSARQRLSSAFGQVSCHSF